ncbi:hypothetical protein Nepgr_027017 [Nepenthes gracilis]|uniref:Uncharacterized protein n=1 Tax=Nepenthes gracilis TaxID=150966 RepID=A0AAD3TA38_NEPGR|nr:hypothetical protein Nepgr_027017 [Nepenthes gracilis]
MEESSEELRKTFSCGTTRRLQWRKSQIQSLAELLADNEHHCFQALHQDIGNPTMNVTGMSQLQMSDVTGYFLKE